MAPTHYVLAIDQAAASGWSVVEAPTLRVLAFGLAKTPAERAAAVAEALRLAGELPLRVVFEDHSGIPMTRGKKGDRGQAFATRSTATILGMGKARGWWEERLALVGMPRAHYAHDVEPKVWRRAVLGRVKGDGLKSEAITCASAHVGRVLADDNVAEAVLIGLYAAREMKLVGAKRAKEVG